jgi:hypothetical protein
MAWTSVSILSPPAVAVAVDAAAEGSAEAVTGAVEGAGAIGGAAAGMGGGAAAGMGGGAVAGTGGGAADGTAGAAAFRGRGGRTGLCDGASSAVVAFPAPAVGLSVNSTGVPSAAPSRAFRIPFRSATAVPLTAVILHSTRAPLVCEAGAASGSARGRRVDRQAGGEEGMACVN